MKVRQLVESDSQHAVDRALEEIEDGLHALEAAVRLCDIAHEPPSTAALLKVWELHEHLETIYGKIEKVRKDHR